jgi:AcrR family transcriptional regulator
MIAAKKPGRSHEVAPRIARREKRRERSREEIVEAARRVIKKNGIAGATLDAVAIEVGLTKAALYYYYPSKEALFFDVMFGSFSAQACAIQTGVENARDGGEALAAIIRETVKLYADHLDDFRLAFLQTQLVKPGTVRFTPEQFAKIRPLNDLTYGAASKRVAEEWKAKRGRARVEPRLLVFLAHAAALGVLTMKGLVESVDDPLIYSDDQLIEGLAQIFQAAAQP